MIVCLKYYTVNVENLAEWSMHDDDERVSEELGTELVG
jgi:hypothetical protein